MFSSVVTDYWRTTFSDGNAASGDEAFSVAVNADLSEDRRVMMLQTFDGRSRAVLTPSVAGALGWSREAEPMSESRFRQALSDAGLPLYDADYLFYYPEPELRTLMQQPPCEGIRQLSGADAAIFDEFAALAPEQDLDNAYGTGPLGRIRRLRKRPRGQRRQHVSVGERPLGRSRRADAARAQGARTRPCRGPSGVQICRRARISTAVSMPARQPRIHRAGQGCGTDTLRDVGSDLSRRVTVNHTL